MELKNRMLALLTDEVLVKWRDMARLASDPSLVLERAVRLTVSQVLKEMVDEATLEQEVANKQRRGVGDDATIEPERAAEF